MAGNAQTPEVGEDIAGAVVLWAIEDNHTVLPAEDGEVVDKEYAALQKATGVDKQGDGKFRVRIAKKQYGRYDTLEEAIAAYGKGKKEHIALKNAKDVKSRMQGRNQVWEVRCNKRPCKSVYLGVYKSQEDANAANAYHQRQVHVLEIDLQAALDNSPEVSQAREAAAAAASQDYNSLVNDMNEVAATRAAQQLLDLNEDTVDGAAAAAPAAQRRSKRLKRK